MRRTLFTADHEDFRGMIRDFLSRKVVPVFPEWLEQEVIPREFWRSLAKLGIFGLNIDEEYGGSGEADFRYSVVLTEEVARALVHLGPLRCHLDVVMPYFLAYCDEEQRGRWFPKIAEGESFTAIAMTEPGTGSDLAGIRTGAVTRLYGGTSEVLKTTIGKSLGVGPNGRRDQPGPHRLRARDPVVAGELRRGPARHHGPDEGALPNTVTGTRDIPDGAEITVDGRTGTVRS